jgi:hypothetical protein
MCGVIDGRKETTDGMAQSKIRSKAYSKNFGSLAATGSSLAPRRKPSAQRSSNVQSKRRIAHQAGASSSDRES